MIRVTGNTRRLWVRRGVGLAFAGGMLCAGWYSSLGVVDALGTAGSGARAPWGLVARPLAQAVVCLAVAIYFLAAAWRGRTGLDLPEIDEVD